MLSAVLDARLFAAGNHNISPDEGRGEAMTGHDVMTRLSSAFVRDLVINGFVSRLGRAELTNGIIKV